MGDMDWVVVWRWWRALPATTRRRRCCALLCSGATRERDGEGERVNERVRARATDCSPLWHGRVGRRWRTATMWRVRPALVGHDVRGLAGFSLDETA